MDVGVGPSRAGGQGGIMSRSSLPPPLQRRRDSLQSSESGGAWESYDVEGSEQAIDPDELREFLAADALECEADPIFKERLRQKLWRIVRKSEPDD